MPSNSKGAVTFRFGFRDKLNWNYSLFRHISSRWGSSAMTFGGVAGLAFLYITDWKLVVKKIPFYGGQFPDVEEEE